MNAPTRQPYEDLGGGKAGHTPTKGRRQEIANLLVQTLPEAPPAPLICSGMRSVVTNMAATEAFDAQDAFLDLVRVVLLGTLQGFAAELFDLATAITMADSDHARARMCEQMLGGSWQAKAFTASVFSRLVECPNDGETLHKGLTKLLDAAFSWCLNNVTEVVDEHGMEYLARGFHCQPFNEYPAFNGACPGRTKRLRAATTVLRAAYLAAAATAFVMVGLDRETAKVRLMRLKEDVDEKCAQTSSDHDKERLPMCLSGHASASNLESKEEWHISDF